MTEFFDETGIIRKQILFRNFLEGVFFRFNFFVFFWDGPLVKLIKY